MDGKEAFVPTTAATWEKPVFEAGENQLIGEADGKFGPIYVRVTKDGDIISDVEVLQSWETPFLTDDAVAKVVASIVESNSPDVDVCSGATVTCVALCNAVRNALA